MSLYMNLNVSYIGLINIIAYNLLFLKNFTQVWIPKTVVARHTSVKKTLVYCLLKGLNVSHLYFVWSLTYISTLRVYFAFEIPDFTAFYLFYSSVICDPWTSTVFCEAPITIEFYCWTALKHFKTNCHQISQMLKN